MKKWGLFILLFQLSVSAQFRGVVLDSISKQPVSFANVWVENENKGATSEENGQFSIQTDEENKTLIISALGYETKKIKMAWATKVLLKPIAFQLNEVEIRTKKETKKLEIGNSKNRYCNQLSGGLPWMFAKYFPYEVKYKLTPFIQNAILFTDSEIKNATFKLRIFEKTSDGLPGADLLEEDIIVIVKKGHHKNTIDLSKYNLSLPTNGLFVAFEWMIIDANKYQFEYKENGTLKSFPTYAPSAVCNEVEVENSYDFRSGKWNKRQKFFINNKSKEVMLEPAINLTLTN
jgi:hypothetical protein